MVDSLERWYAIGVWLLTLSKWPVGSLKGRAVTVQVRLWTPRNGGMCEGSVCLGPLVNIWRRGLEGCAGVLSGFAHLFRTGNNNLITYKLSTSMKVSNAELSHASKSTVARHQRNRAGAQKQKVLWGCEVANQCNFQCPCFSPSVRAWRSDAFNEQLITVLLWVGSK